MHRYVMEIRIESKPMETNIDPNKILAAVKEALADRPDLLKIHFLNVHRWPVYDHTPFEYKGIPLQLINRSYDGMKAKRFTLNRTNQNVWIPNKHLDDMGRLKDGEDIDYVFLKSRRQCEIAGIDLITLRR